MDPRYVITTLLLLGVAVLIVQALRLRRKQSEVFDEFEEHFPDKCAICAFHQFRQREGWVPSTSVPEDHRCKEGLQRFRGTLHRRAP